MRSQDNTAGRPDVVAEFDNQDAADDAVSGLWAAGLPGRRVGYFYRTPRGLEPVQPRDRRASGSVIGLLVGTALGVLIGWAVAGPLGPVDAAVACVLLSAPLGGMAGWVLGSCVRLRGVRPPDAPEGTGPFVVAADTRGNPGRVRAVLQRHGGRDLSPTVNHPVHAVGVGPA